MNVQLTPKTLAVILSAVIAVLAIGGWFVLVGAQQSTASSLATETADAEAELAALEQAERAAIADIAASKASRPGKATKGATQSSLLQIAFPSQVAMPSILLQTQRLATASGVSLEAFAPSMPTPVVGYSSIPIDVTVNGRYRAIQRFVHALRVQAGSSGGRVHAKGRLFSVETVGMTVAPGGAPQLSATIHLSAFVFAGGLAPPTEGENATDTGAEGGSTSTSAEGTP